MSEAAKVVFSYAANNISGVSGLTGQSVSYATRNQSGLSTSVGITATTVSFAEGIPHGYAGKFSGAGNLLGLAQVGVNIYDNNGDTSKLTAGDLLNIAGAMAMFVPGGQVLGVAISIGGAAYSIYEGKYGPVTVQDIGDYWYDKFNESSNDWNNQNRSGKFFFTDPLTLDLDGDGIETVGTNAYKGALFDHDKDGIQTATGWVASDDGFLVIDRNEDGIINNGNELFGDNYTLKDGATECAQTTPTAGLPRKGTTRVPDLMAAGWA
ncbi:hypothetical protein [Neisseria wadsworthii]|nr:hypothetical protein H3L96_04690 [Neisseria wadsworthii]